MADGMVNIAPFGPSVSEEMQALIETPGSRRSSTGPSLVFPDPIVNQAGNEQPLGDIFEMDYFVEGVIGSPTG